MTSEYLHLIRGMIRQAYSDGQKRNKCEIFELSAP